MTYFKDRVEYLDADERRVYKAVEYLNGRKRTTNNSQIAAATGFSRTKVSQIVWHLSARKFLTNTGKGAAYHWRTATDIAKDYSRPEKPVKESGS